MQKDKKKSVDKPVPEVVRELTPELAEKVWKAIQKNLYDKRVAQEHVLHHLKQLKAEIGKRVAKYKDTRVEGSYQDGLRAVSMMIDKKIAKLK